MELDKNCRRCSTARVNALCHLYKEAYGENQSQSFINLKALVQLARERGYVKSPQVLRPGLRSDEVRSLAWNISSVLQNRDLERLGIPLNDNGHGRPEP
jgi:hypothetical protein